MNSHKSNSNTQTKIWKNNPNGKILVSTVAGFPFGTELQAFIPKFGQAARTGIQTSGSGQNEILLEVEYTLI